jgi:hypothetical protein
MNNRGGDRDNDPRSGVGPPPHRRMGGTIDVIGSSKKDSRRPMNEDAGFGNTICTTGGGTNSQQQPSAL